MTTYNCRTTKMYLKEQNKAKQIYKNKYIYKYIYI